jgi:hypothetical protein
MMKSARFGCLVLALAASAVTQPASTAGVLAGPFVAVQSEGTALIDDLMWAVRSNGENVNWEGAIQYCDNLVLDGHEDWRLPRIDEVEALYDPNAAGEFPVSSPIRLEFCCLWSSTILEEDGDPRRLFEPSRYAWGFYFPTGIQYYSAMGFADGEALCVRMSG